MPTWRHQNTQIPATKMTRSIAKVLQEEGFIAEFEEVGEGVKRNLVSLKYKGKNRQPLITTLKRVSKPGLQVYSNRKELPRVLGGIGCRIVSTSSELIGKRDVKAGW